MTNDLSLCGNRRGLCDFSLQSTGGDHVAGLDVNFVNGPSNSIGRSELPLLEAAFDVDVLALLIGHRNFGNLAVEDKAVPVRVRLWFAVTPDEVICLAETDIRHLHAGRKKSKLWLRRQVTREFDPIFLHDDDGL